MAGIPKTHEEDILFAIEQIKLEGTEPTVAAVQKRVGGGTDRVHRVLQTWRDSTTKYQALRDEMPNDLLAAMERFAGLAFVSARSALRTQAMAESEALRRELSAAHDNAQSQEERAEALDHQLATAKETIRGLEASRSELEQQVLTATALEQRQREIIAGLGLVSAA